MTTSLSVQEQELLEHVLYGKFFPTPDDVQRMADIEALVVLIRRLDARIVKLGGWEDVK